LGSAGTVHVCVCVTPPLACPLLPPAPQKNPKLLFLPGKMLHEIKSLVTEEPKYWLDVLSTWRNLHGHEGKKGNVSQEDRLPLKRKSEEEANTATKRQKTEQVREPVSEECRVEAGERCVVPERKSNQDCWTESKTSLEDPPKSSGEKPVANEQLSFSFRVSCRCSGAIARILPSQVCYVLKYLCFRRS